MLLTVLAANPLRLNPLQRPVDPAHDVEPAAEYTETETQAGKNTNPFFLRRA
jgi:hypothetical protein